MNTNNQNGNNANQTDTKGKMNLPDIEKVTAKVHHNWMQGQTAKGVTTKELDGEELMQSYEQLSDKAKDHSRTRVNNVYQAIEELHNEGQEGHANAQQQQHSTSTL
jgi:hypothetical protein